MNMITKLTKGKQITIPASIREALNLTVGSAVEVSLSGHDIVVTPIDGDLKKLFTKARKTKPRRHVTAEEMDAWTENGIYR